MSSISSIHNMKQIAHILESTGVGTREGGRMEIVRSKVVFADGEPGILYSVYDAHRGMFGPYQTICPPIETYHDAPKPVEKTSALLTIDLGLMGKTHLIQLCQMLAIRADTALNEWTEYEIAAALARKARTVLDYLAGEHGNIAMATYYCPQVFTPNWPPPEEKGE